MKGNQPALHEAVRAVFDRACEAELAGVNHDGGEAVEGYRRSGRTWRQWCSSVGSGR